MKKIAALLLALVLALTAVSAMAELTQADVFQRCVDFAQENEFDYDASEGDGYVFIGLSTDNSAFSPDGYSVWLFAYDDGISIDFDFNTRVPEDRYNEMLTILALLNSKSSEGHFYASPSSLRIGATDYCYAVDTLPSVAELTHMVVQLYNKVQYYDAMINEVANGAAAWDVYNAYYGE